MRKTIGIAMVLAVASGSGLSGQSKARAAHAVVAAAQTASVPAMPRFRFQNFTTANGPPPDQVSAVLVDGDRVWAGTDNGLAEYENGQWKVYTPADGLAHRAVLSLALDKRTGAVW